MEEEKNWGGKREGAGRPKGVKKPYKTFSCAMPVESIDRLKNAAETVGLSVPKLLQKMTEDILNGNYRPE